MENTDDAFSVWLLTKLNEMKVDESIFLEYIRSILEGEETRDEKLEILESVLMDSFSSVSITVSLNVSLSRLGFMNNLSGNLFRPKVSI